MVNAAEIKYYLEEIQTAILGMASSQFRQIHSQFCQQRPFLISNTGEALKIIRHAIFSLKN